VSDDDVIIGEMRLLREQRPSDVLRWLNDRGVQQRFHAARLMRAAYGLPVEMLASVGSWNGFGGDASDDEVDAALVGALNRSML
jgi:hypothetical protein